MNLKTRLHRYILLSQLLLCSLVPVCLTAHADSLPAGPQVATFLSSVDGSEQPYGLYLPRHYDSRRKYPLVVMLHGAGSNHRLDLRRVFGKSNAKGESDADATKYFPPWNDIDYIVACPLARGTMGYQGLPERDVYDVLADVEKRFTIDENRVYLTGLSMGGGGTLWIGLTRPDIWAAIAPVCPAPPAGTIFLAPNALNFPVQVSQGDVDQAVNPAKTREFVEHLRLEGTRIEYHEYPGVGHNVWEDAYKDEAIFKWFDHYRREPFPERVRFVSSRYRYDRAYWVHLDELTPGTLATIDARFTGRNELTITTADLDAFSLNLTGHPKFNPKHVLKISLDGQTLETKPGEPFSFHKKGWIWSAAKFEPTPESKRPGAEGPLADIGYAKQIYVYGTADHPAQDELDKRKDQATQAAHWAAVTFPVMADTEVGGADLDTGNLVLLGNRGNNSLIAKFNDQLPLALKPDATNYGLVYIYPVNHRYLLVNSGLPWWTLPTGVRTAGGRNGGPAGMLRAMDSDFLLFKESANEIVADGRFDHDWHLAAQASRELRSGDVVQTNVVKNPKYWTVEDPAEREKLPLYQIIPAAKPGELTRANGLPKRESFLEWPRSHGGNGGTRFSALDQINRQNVTNLQVVWTYHSQDGADRLECNPIVVNGIMYAPSAGKCLVAVDAATGGELWRFKTEGRPAFRGLVYWPGDGSSSERILFCAGKTLYALNPKTGLPEEEFGDHGQVPLPGHASREFGASTAAPAIYQHRLIVPGWEKDIWAFDIVSGKLQWTFHTVPQPGEFGYDTWDHTENYAANCWAGMVLDEARGIAFFTTGGPKENFIGVDHLGQNLFSDCVIALDAATGKRLWHFQEIRHDIWDLDISSPPILTTITREGKRVDVVAAISKVGNTMLLDRVSGKPIFPFRLRRAPVSDLPGERTWPYQPDLELPQPLSKQDFSADDITDRTPEAHDYVLGRFKGSTAGWFRPFTEGKMNIFYGLLGGGEWVGSCSDPSTGRLYVSVNHTPSIVTVFRDVDPPLNPNTPKTPGQTVFEQRCAACHGTNLIGFGICPPLRGLRNRTTDDAVTKLLQTGRNAMPAQTDLSDTDLKALLDFLMVRDRPIPPAADTERPRYSFNGYPKFFDHEGYPASKPPWATLDCLNLNTGKIEWAVPLGEIEELKTQGMRNTGAESLGGPILTAGGLVFCGGTPDSKFRAFDQDTGRELWSAKLPFVGSAPATSYQVNGRQFIVVPATGGGKIGGVNGDAYVAFALPPVKN